MTLAEALDAPDDVIFGEELTRDERAALVGRRFESGEWGDLYYGHELIDLERALEELAAGSEIGTYLLERAERAIEMVIEDARREESA